jgi:2-iminobutanoate/2-iminopropanoate deaminase
MTTTRKIHTNKAPAAVGPYSQAVEANGLVFVSGQTPIDPATGKLVADEIKTQTARVIDNLEQILKEAGLDLGNVVRCDVFLKDMNEFKAMNEVYGSRFSQDPRPARQTVEVARLPLDARVEISCIAAR